MKRILCFGDSNTWGAIPATPDRYAAGQRWPGVMARSLGDDFTVIEEGQPGRTTLWADPVERVASGLTDLPVCLVHHRPLDAVILLLGTNDTKARFGVGPEEIAGGIERLGRLVLTRGAGREQRAPHLLIVAPPPLAKLTAHAALFAGGTEKSRGLSARYAAVARRLGAGYYAAERVVHSSDRDGIHWDAESHAALGRALAPLIALLVAASAAVHAG
ncbi:MAG: SGNH/GDSL hydrolase family protein [Opitutae bacterium]|nr:SGNH/GDSL hydrolase family protein [Opitutae bacterium]